MTVSAQDCAFMAQALVLASRGVYTTDPNPRVGCVIVRDGKVVGEGWHARAGEAHAEVAALQAAGSAAEGADVYVTLEPCCHHGRTPPCTDALLAAGVTRVIIASRDPNPAVAGGGEAALRKAGVHVDEGVLESEARALNVGYITRMTAGRPYVRSKIAVSLDGRTALANGISQWITGTAARADVQRLRARSSAILTGVDTIIADNPALNVRAPDLGEICQPVRVIADTHLRTPAGAQTLALPEASIVFAIAGPDAESAPLDAAGARVEFVTADADGRVDLAAMLARLAELGMNDVLVEAGPRLNGGLLQAGLIDELVVYMAGSILGDDARGMFDMPELTEMSFRPEFNLRDVRRVGEDLRLTWSRAEETT